MSIIDRLEDAIVSANYASGLTGKPRLVAVTPEDARRILAALRLHACSDPGDICVECDQCWPCGTAGLLDTEES